MGRPINLHKFGGIVSKADLQLEVKANLSGTPNVTAGLVQQKKQRTFRVEDSVGNKALCTFVDKAPAACLEGEMSMRITPAVGPTFYVKRITNRYVWDFSNVRYTWAFNATTGKVVAEAS
jgi:hypothetical protein